MYLSRRQCYRTVHTQGQCQQQRRCLAFSDCCAKSEFANHAAAWLLKISLEDGHHGDGLLGGGNTHTEQPDAQ